MLEDHIPVDTDAEYVFCGGFFFSRQTLAAAGPLHPVKKVESMRLHWELRDSVDFVCDMCLSG
jgi:hypothetical protein